MRGLYAEKITDIDMLGLGEIEELDEQFIRTLDEIMSLLRYAEIKKAYTLLRRLRHDTATHLEQIKLAQDYIMADMEWSAEDYIE